MLCQFQIEILIDNILINGLTDGVVLFWGLSNQSTMINEEDIISKIPNAINTFKYLTTNCRNSHNIHKYLLTQTKLDKEISKEVLSGEKVIP